MRKIEVLRDLFGLKVTKLVEVLTNTFSIPFISLQNRLKRNHFFFSFCFPIHSAFQVRFHVWNHKPGTTKYYNIQFIKDFFLNSEGTKCIITIHSFSLLLSAFHAWVELAVLFALRCVCEAVRC